MESRGQRLAFIGEGAGRGRITELSLAALLPGKGKLCPSLRLRSDGSAGRAPHSILSEVCSVLTSS